jgi:hypothetical protein
MKPKHQGGYTQRHTEFCERTLVTLMRGLGPWKKCIYLAGGLVPRYLIGSTHLGTSDVDLVLDLQILSEVEAYRTLEQNLKALGFERNRNEDGVVQHFSWTKTIEGGGVVGVDLLCPDWENMPGRAKSLPGNAKISALRIPGAHLIMRDFVEVTLEVELLNDRGVARETIRVADTTAFIVLKALAYEERMEEKDAFDLIYCLLHGPGGPKGVGQSFRRRLGEWPEEELLPRSLAILEDRFGGLKRDGPTSYARFQIDVSRQEQTSSLRQAAYTAVSEFLKAVSDPS